MLSALVSSENIAGIHFLFYIIQAFVISVGNDGLTLLLECVEIVHNPAAEEGASVFQGWLIDDNLCAFSLDAFHDTLNAALTEVVAVTLHGESVYTDDA